MLDLVMVEVLEGALAGQSASRLLGHRTPSPPGAPPA